jgi:succinylglutamate desuccinylase
VEYFERFIELAGTDPGSTSVVLVGVHGDEVCGVQALERLLPSLAIEQGRVFIGYGNPRAIGQGKRQIDVNLNRMFKPDDELSPEERASYEYRRAQEIRPYLDQSEVLLDVHASMDPDSRPFILCEENAAQIARHLPFNLMVSGFDAVEPGGTDYYMNRTGKIGICVECGFRENPQSTDIAVESICTFLRIRGHVRSRIDIAYEQNRIVMYDLYRTKTDFQLAKAFTDFEELQEGQVIGTDGGISVTAPRKSIILFAQNREVADKEAFLLGEYRP